MRAIFPAIVGLFLLAGCESDKPAPGPPVVVKIICHDPDHSSVDSCYWCQYGSPYCEGSLARWYASNPDAVVEHIVPLSTTVSEQTAVSDLLLVYRMPDPKPGKDK